MADRTGVRVSSTLLAMAAAALGGCSDFDGPDPKYGVSASPRVATGATVLKGGGDYKVGRPYKVAGRWYVPRAVASYDRSGVASWYGSAFHGRRTANGEVYDMNALTAGHPTLPMPSYAYVTNLQNGRTIMVRINDRGPYVNDRLIDLSWRSAKELGFAVRGLARVRVRYAGPAPLDGSDATAITLAASVWAAPTDSAPFATRARAAVLMDGDTGAIMFQHNADELMPPASVSKLMTLEIAFQAIKDGCSSSTV